MVFLYNLFIQLYHLGIRLAALGGGKPKQWLQGRVNMWTEMKQDIKQGEPIIWVHSASAGEFEQAKPVIEALKQAYPQYKIAATFFSPSGYNVGKKSKLADYVFYLPLDTAANAKRLIFLLKPQLVVFVKYDYWYHHLKQINQSGIPLLLVSAIFRPNQAFFKWYGGFYKKMLHFFTHLFVQDEPSKTLLIQHGVQHVTISGDTRFDRVATIAKGFSDVLEVPIFAKGHPLIVAGSTWPEDEEMLQKVLETFNDVKLVIAPHEINETHLKSIESLFPSFRFSKCKEAFDVEYKPELQAYVNKEKTENTEALQKQFQEAKVLIIDNVGMLSRLYKYATITYIGGGFNKSGIHNTLEAAVWGKPVVWGPNFQKFREAKGLLAAGGGFSYTSTEDLKGILDVLLKDGAARRKAGIAAAEYVQQHRGATEKIIAYIQEKRLLTRL